MSELTALVAALEASITRQAERREHFDVAVRSIREQLKRIDQELAALQDEPSTPAPVSAPDSGLDTFTVRQGLTRQAWETLKQGGEVTARSLSRALRVPTGRTSGALVFLFTGKHGRHLSRTRQGLPGGRGYEYIYTYKGGGK